MASPGMIRQIQRYVELPQDFGARPLCIPKKTNELSFAHNRRHEFRPDGFTFDMNPEPLNAYY
jgi:hypothetical protein